MNLKKTWFSYVLWLVVTGLSIYFSLMFIRNLCLYMGINSGLTNGFMYSFPIVGILLAFLLRVIVTHVKLPSLSKGVRYAVHVILLFILIAVFAGFRFDTLRSIDSLEIIENSAIYQSALIGNNSDSSLLSGVQNQLYSSVISGLLLFLGNKAIAIVYFQLVLQILSFVMLCVSGYLLKKGILGFMPALVYAVSPLFYQALPEATAANFTFCLCVSWMFLVILLCKKHDKKAIDYVWSGVAGIASGLLIVYNPMLLALAVFVLVVLFEKENTDIKERVLLALTYVGMAAVSYGICAAMHGISVKQFLAVFLAENQNRLSGMEYGSVTAFVILSAFLWVYCVSFWFSSSDNGHVYVIPIAVYALMHFVGASYQDAKILLMLMQLFMAFVIVEGMRMLAVKKEKKTVIAEDIEPSIEAEENVVETKEQDPIDRTTPIDRTAPIENVLPMPKKHVPKVLDYAFEPKEDEMHYDIEVENDDYDY